jgi:hypothetical protein
MRLAVPGTFKHSADHIGDDCAHETADAGYSTPHSTKQPGPEEIKKGRMMNLI